jgi:hypothetical protein
MAPTTVTLADLPHPVRGEVIIDAARRGPRPRTAALHLLTAPTLIADPRVWRHARGHRSRTGPADLVLLTALDLDRALAESGWPARERTLLEAAASLSPTDPACAHRVDLGYVARLGVYELGLVLDAVTIARGSKPWPAGNDLRIRDACRALADWTGVAP